MTLFLSVDGFLVRSCSCLCICKNYIYSRNNISDTIMMTIIDLFNAKVRATVIEIRVVSDVLDNKCTNAYGRINTRARANFQVSEAKANHSMVLVVMPVNIIGLLLAQLQASDHSGIRLRRRTCNVICTTCKFDFCCFEVALQLAACNHHHHRPNSSQSEKVRYCLLVSVARLAAAVANFFVHSERTTTDWGTLCGVLAVAAAKRGAMINFYCLRFTRSHFYIFFLSSVLLQVALMSLRGRGSGLLACARPLLYECLRRSLSSSIFLV